MGNYTKTGANIENLLILINEEVKAVQKAISNFSADYIEDVFEIFEALLSETGSMLLNLEDELPEEFQSEKLGAWANIMDVSSDAANVPMLIANIVGILKSSVGAFGNIMDLVAAFN